jgi:hypothetical protein
LIVAQIVEIPFFFASCLKTINNKKYGVDLVCFTSHLTTVMCSSKNGWDGMLIQKPMCVYGLFRINLFMWLTYSESLRLLSLHDNKYLRYFKVTMTGLVSHTTNVGNFIFLFKFSFFILKLLLALNICVTRGQLLFLFLGLCHSACALARNALSLVLLIKLYCFGINKLRSVRWRNLHISAEKRLVFNWVIYYLWVSLWRVQGRPATSYDENLHLEDTSECLVLANMRGLVSICKSMGVLIRFV